MRFTVLCNDQAIGEVELDPAKRQQSGLLASYPAYEAFRSILEREADARWAWQERIAEAMPESLFASVAEGNTGKGLVSHRLSPEILDSEHPELAAIVRQGPGATTLRFRVEGEHGDTQLGSARVHFWIPPSGIRARGVPPHVIVLKEP